MKTVAVVFGSRSAEHDISVVTAIAAVIAPLKLSGQYKVVPVYISKQGEWYSDPTLAEIELYTSGRIDLFLRRTKPISLNINNGLTIVKSGLRPVNIKVDLVFPATHGTYGEDGTLMGLLEMANVPYVGCGLAASVVAMDKVLSKQVTAANHIPSTPWVWTTREKFLTDPKRVLKEVETAKLKYPLFVKPAHLGSSIGISRVNKKTELENALEVAAHYDDKVIIEQGVANLIEVTLPIMGNDQLRPALLEMPLTQPEDFFDFDTKYLQGGKKGKSAGNKGAAKGSQGYSQIPAQLPKKLYQKAEKTALDTYRAIGCSGTARVDLLIDGKAGKVYFNEVNPLPGSLYAHNWNRAGISNIELVSELVKLAEERFGAKQKLATTFSTSFLKQF